MFCTSTLSQPSPPPPSPSPPPPSAPLYAQGYVGCFKKVVTTSMQAQMKKMGGVDKVDELMDQVDEVQQDARDIQDAMNRQMNVPGLDQDDDELLAELDGFMEAQLAADMSKVDLGRAVVMPSAPISLPAAGTKKVMTDEERELAEREAAMAG